jgi:hypothetical protein
MSKQLIERYCNNIKHEYPLLDGVTCYECCAVRDSAIMDMLNDCDIEPEFEYLLENKDEYQEYTCDECSLNCYVRNDDVECSRCRKNDQLEYAVKLYKSMLPKPQPNVPQQEPDKHKIKLKLKIASKSE